MIGEAAGLLDQRAGGAHALLGVRLMPDEELPFHAAQP